MAISKAQQKAVAKYKNANYDRIELPVPTGKKEEYNAAADQLGISLNAFINEAVDAAMQRAN